MRVISNFIPQVSFTFIHSSFNARAAQYIFASIKRNLTITTKSVSVFGFIQSAEAIAKNAKAFCKEKLKSVMKMMQHTLSFIAALADNALLFGLLLFADSPLYKNAKLVKDGASLLRNLFAIGVCVLILKKRVKNSNNVPRRPQKTGKGKKRAAEPPHKQEENENTAATKYDLIASAMHTVSLMAAFGFLPIHSKAMVCGLDIVRYIVKIRKNLARGT